MSNIPNSPTKVQQEGAQTTRPVSESLMFSVGGAVNYALTNSGKVGDVVMSDLTESAFQSLRDTTWQLSDGRSCVGTQYATLTGRSTLPDRRGTYARACDDGRGLDPNGAKNPGDYVADQVGPHSHTVTAATRDASGADGGSGFGGLANNHTLTTANNTGAETAPKTVYTNFFVKVNP